MISIVLSVIIGVLAAIGSLFSVASHLTRDSFLRRYSPAGRALFATSLGVFSIIAGWYALNEARSRLTADRSDDHRQRVASVTSVVNEGRSAAAQFAKQGNLDREPPLPPLITQPRPERSTTKETSTPRIRIQDDSGNLVPELAVIAQRELPADLIVEGTLHTTTTPPDESLQGLITAKARLSVTTKNGEHLIDGFDLDTRGGGFTAEDAIRQALERLDAEFTKRLKEHP